MTMMIIWATAIWSVQMMMMIKILLLMIIMVIIFRYEQLEATMRSLLKSASCKFYHKMFSCHTLQSHCQMELRSDCHNYKLKESGNFDFQEPWRVLDQFTLHNCDHFFHFQEPRRMAHGGGCHSNGMLKIRSLNTF